MSVSALALVGVVVLARTPGRRQVLLCYSLILVLGVLISSGEDAFLLVLHEHVVFFRGLRPSRASGSCPCFR